MDLWDSISVVMLAALFWCP